MTYLFGHVNVPD